MPGPSLIEPDADQNFIVAWTPEWLSSVGRYTMNNSHEAALNAWR
jgi:hypothetical protein